MLGVGCHLLWFAALVLAAPRVTGYPTSSPLPPQLNPASSPCCCPQVKEITKRFLKPGFTTVDLVGTDKMKVRGHDLAAGWM